MLYLYAMAVVNIDPDDREIPVGSFDDALSRALWARDTAHAQARKLSSELGFGQGGITVATRFVDSYEELPNAISPDNFPRVMLNTYRDVYVAQ